MAREEPYVYQQGDKEIDAAIADTFDGIAIAPGMHAVIKDGTDKVLAEKDGPWLAQDASYATGAFASRMFDGLKNAGSTMPQWIVDYVASHTNVEALPLHAARSVKVSALANGRCAFESATAPSSEP